MTINLNSLGDMIAGQVVPEVAQMPAAEQGFFGKLGSAIEAKPEQFAIMMDMIGRGFDPNNPFAGVGTAMGQSSLAAKAARKEKQERQDWRKFLGGMMSGKIPTTPAGEPGVTGMSIKPSKEGGANEMTLSITEPTDAGKVKAAQDKTVRMGDLMSYPF